MVKKLQMIVLAIVLVAGLLAGCAPSATPTAAPSQPQTAAPTKAAAPAEPVSLKFWGGVPAEYGPDLTVQAFNTEFKAKGLSAEYVRFVNDDTGNVKLETTLLSGSEIDLFMTYTAANLVKRGTGGMTIELSDRLKKAGFDPVKELGDGVTPYIYDGKIFCLPTKMENYVLLANKNMFDAAGIPLPTSWTYDEFREIAKKLTKGEGQEKIYGMYWNSAQEIFRPSYLAQTVLGANYLYKEGGKETNLDNPEFIKLNQLVADMMLKDKSTVTHTDTVTQKLSVESVFLAGKSAMSVGVWTIRSNKDLAKYPHDFVTAYLPVPVSDKSAAKYSIGEGVIGDYLCLNSKSKHPDEAFQFMMWYIKGGMTPMVQFGRVPIYKGIDPKTTAAEYMKGGEKILDPGTVAKWLEPAKSLAVSTQTNKLPEVSKVFTDALESIYTGQQDAATALKAAKVKADAFLK
jgi:multiple sugar transport system substrate-binding protein